MKHNSLQNPYLNFSIYSEDSEGVKMKSKSQPLSQFTNYLSASKAMKESECLSESIIVIEDSEQESSSVESSEDSEDSIFRRY